MQKAVFITGAGAGIGAAIARRFAQAGWRVGLFDQDEAAVRQLAAELGEHAHAAKLDVTDAAGWQSTLADFFAWAGRLDVLVNNAGVLLSGALTEAPLAQHVRLLSVNTEGILNGCYLALPYLQQTPGARVINLSSASAIYGQLNLASYSASKFAVRGLTEALDLEWAAHGIRVLDIMPLFVQTRMIAAMNTGSIRRMPMRTRPEQVAATVWRAAHARAAWAPTHWPVGWPVRLMWLMSNISPGCLNRWVNLHLGR